MRVSTFIAALLLVGVFAPLRAQEDFPYVPPVRVIDAPRVNNSPAPRPRIMVWDWATAALETEQTARQPLMRRAQLDFALSTIPLDQFPPHLLTQPGIRTERVDVVVDLDAAGQPTGCTPDVIWVTGRDRWQGEEPDEDALFAQVCAHAMATFGYHHALDAGGNPVAASIRLQVEYKWSGSYSVGPPPIHQWRRRVNSIDDWPDNQLSWRADEATPIALGEGSQFVSADSDRPPQADVGLIFSAYPDGTVTSCRVAQPSGVSAYDEASCPIVQSQPQDSRFRNYPVLLHWRGQSVRAEMPVETIGPSLVTLPILDPAMLAGEAPPEHSLRVELGVSPEGSLTYCEVGRPSFNDVIDAATCRLFPEGQRFTIPRGNFGEPVEATLALFVDWRTLTIQQFGR